jgi:hypothetical protein
MPTHIYCRVLLWQAWKRMNERSASVKTSKAFAQRRKRVTHRSHNVAMDRVNDEASNVLATFLVEVYNEQAFKRTVNLYLRNVRKVQICARNFHVVTHSRLLALKHRWADVEAKNSKELTKYISDMHRNSHLNGGHNVVEWIDECNRQWHRTHKKVQNLHGRMDKLGVGAQSEVATVEDQIRWGISSHYLPMRRTHLLRKYLMQLRKEFQDAAFSEYQVTLTRAKLPDCCRDFNLEDAAQLMGGDFDSTSTALRSGELDEDGEGGEQDDESPTMVQLKGQPISRKCTPLSQQPPPSVVAPGELASVVRFPTMMLLSRVDEEVLLGMIQQAIWELFAVNSIERRWRTMRAGSAFFKWKDNVYTSKVKLLLRGKFQKAAFKVSAGAKAVKILRRVSTDAAAERAAAERVAVGGHT